MSQDDELYYKRCLFEIQYMSCTVHVRWQGCLVRQDGSGTSMVWVQNLISTCGSVVVTNQDWWFFFECSGSAPPISLTGFNTERAIMSEDMVNHGHIHMYC